MNPKSNAKRILKELDFDFRDFTIDNFTSWIEERKGRRIFSTPWTMPPGMFGVWLSDGNEPREYIFYRDDVPKIHQIHIRLHELSHYLCNHPTMVINRENIAELFQGDADLSLFELARTRSILTTDMEIEAETLASIIQEQVVRHAQLDQLTSGISSDEKLAGYLKDLGLIQ